MRKSALWCIPCAFFVIATVLNLLGKLIGLHELSAIVKPALLPLLTATTLAYLMGQEHPHYLGAGLLTAAQLFGCAGDILLIPSGFPYFAGGMVAFLIGHICYMCLFGGQSWKGLSAGYWILAVAVMAALVFGLVKLIGIEGTMFWPMLIYGFGLMMLIFSALAGVLRMPRGSRCTWWILLAGALLFTFSDAQIAMDTFGVLPFAARPFVIMLTYLAAQSLLAIGGVRLILRR
jgi:uncharacterized membrane protein YhhN